RGSFTLRPETLQLLNAGDRTDFDANGVDENLGTLLRRKRPADGWSDLVQVLASLVRPEFSWSELRERLPAEEALRQLNDGQPSRVPEETRQAALEILKERPKEILAEFWKEVGAFSYASSIERRLILALPAVHELAELGGVRGLQTGPTRA